MAEHRGVDVSTSPAACQLCLDSPTGEACVVLLAPAFSWPSLIPAYVRNPNISRQGNKSKLKHHSPASLAKRKGEHWGGGCSRAAACSTTSCSEAVLGFIISQNISRHGRNACGMSSVCWIKCCSPVNMAAPHYTPSSVVKSIDIPRNLPQKG